MMALTSRMTGASLAMSRQVFEIGGWRLRRSRRHRGALGLAVVLSMASRSPARARARAGRRARKRPHGRDRLEVERIGHGDW
jgi:hypothetical protein